MSSVGHKIGVLGGSFDPVHLGHLAAAEDVHVKMGLDKVYFIPAAQSPLKEGSPEASAAERLAMLEAALDPYPQFEALDFEILAGGISYTFDSVRHLAALLPECRLFWIIGADQVAALPRWHRVTELAEQIEFIAIPRPGYLLVNPGVANLRMHEIEVRAQDISSREIRARVKENLPVSLFLPEKVDKFIKSRGLYQESRTSGSLSKPI